MAEEYTEEDFKYLRTGFIPTGKLVDGFVVRLQEAFPGGKLPLYWRYGDHETFMRRYGEQGPIMWSSSASSVTMLAYGQYVLRLWAIYPDTPTMDLSDGLAAQISSKIPVWNISKGILNKTKPFTKRAHILSNTELDIVIDSVRVIYGL